jgi:RNA polymerase sigma factor (sigma-70 family)
MPNNDQSPSRSADLLQRLTAGDEAAAVEIFDRYVERLTHLARSRLATKLASRVDPEDIVMSAYRSFFIAARDGRFRLGHSDDLWRLLVEVTLHKLYHAAHRHLADRRSVNREQRATGASSDFFQFASREPTPDEALAAADELTAILQQLGQRDRQVLELRLQGHEYEEIADRLNCSERTVRRAINEARRHLTARGGPEFVASRARHRPSSVYPPRREPAAPIDTAAVPLKWSDLLLQRQIGAGSSGKVYRALHRDSRKEVAIKFLRKSLVGDNRAMSRFLSEARTVATLRHPAIVTVHGAGQTPGGGLFLMMELVHGQNLEQVRHRQTVSVTDAIRWVRDAARAVAFAHQNGIIHCDLKPSNILLDKDGRVRVTDFGLAVRVFEPDRDQRLWAGTPAFMAPEQVDPCWGAVSPQTDVWGLGGILFFLLFGQPPHTGDDVPSTLASVVSKTPVKFPIPDQPIPSDILQVLGRCLAKTSHERIPHADELANELGSCIRD